MTPASYYVKCNNGTIALVVPQGNGFAVVTYSLNGVEKTAALNLDYWGKGRLDEAIANHETWEHHAQLEKSVRGPENSCE